MLFIIEKKTLRDASFSCSSTTDDAVLVTSLLKAEAPSAQSSSDLHFYINLIECDPTTSSGLLTR